jgi:hypothetical protein
MNNYTWSNTDGRVSIPPMTGDFDMDIDSGPKAHVADTTVSPKDVVRHYDASLETADLVPQISFSIGDPSSQRHGPTHPGISLSEAGAHNQKRKSLPDAPPGPRWVHIRPNTNSVRAVSQPVASSSSAARSQKQRKSSKSEKSGKPKGTAEQGNNKPRKEKGSGTAKGSLVSTKLTQAMIDAGQAAGIEMEELSDRDRFLVLSKQQGMTYKDIRKQGGFAEAESTLRGRYRTLTKNKEARVRKPEWLENDVSYRFLNHSITFRD